MTNSEPSSALPTDRERPRYSERRAGTAFSVALVLTAVLSFMLPHGGVSDDFSDLIIAQGWPVALIGLLWVYIALDALVGLFQARDSWGARLKRLVLILVMPLFRLTISTAYPNEQVWLPRLGWVAVNETVTEDMEMRLALPMILITLLILPVIGAELLLKEAVRENALLALSLHSITALIWFAFVYEFVVLVSLAEKKINFCKSNWINIAIILLPLVSALSKLQVLRFLRLTKISKLLRAYRLRGVFARALRLALMMNLIDRFMQRNVHKYIAHLEGKIGEKREELAELNRKLDQARARLAATEAEQSGEAKGD